MAETNSHKDFIKCPDCSFISFSQGGLGVHRSKLHNISIPDNVDCLYVERIFPEGKSIYCCLCDTTIGSIANFRRHIKSKHKSVKLIESAKCDLCKKSFSDGRGAGVHLKRAHSIGSNTPYPHSPTPVISRVDKVIDYSPRSVRRIRRSQASLSSLLSNTSTSGPHHNRQPPFSSPQDPICTNIPPQPLICDLDPDDEPYPISPSTQPPSPIPTTNHQQSFDLTVALSGCTVVNCDSTNPPLSPNLTPIHLHSPSSPPDFSFVIPPPLQPLSPNSQVSIHNSSGIPHTINPVTETEVSFIGATNVDVTVPSNVSPRYEVILEDLDPDLEHDHSASRPSSPEFTSAHIINPPNIEYQQPASRQPYPANDPTPSDIPADPNPDNNNQSEFVKLWSSRFSSTDSFAAFSYQCDQFASAVVEEGKSKSASKPNSRPSPRPNRPNNRPVNPNRPRVLPNPIEARRLQTLYRLSKKRAARQVLNSNTTSYTGTKDQATQYFTNTFSASPINVDEVLQSLNINVPCADEDPNITAPFSSKDIKNKLKSLANSAPGKDRVEYRHLKLVDPDCKILNIIYNKCLAVKKIPPSWKESTTILIYKKGSSDDPSNFRPIALMSCLYKLFTSLLALRVSNFSIQNNLMSPQQKSARPAEGCHEHTFTLQSIVADCKRSQKNCFFAWLDLRNAFGSINHEAIYLTLKHMGFPESLIELIKDIYTDASTVVRTSRVDETDPIKVNAGVKQGCPISPVLFNLTSELLIRTVLSRTQENPSIPFKLHNQPISILAYADDLVLISRIERRFAGVT